VIKSKVDKTIYQGGWNGSFTKDNNPWPTAARVQRGNNRQAIFFAEMDYLKYLDGRKKVTGGKR
jgi:hypothetical protein